jgi:hypothetical protein
MNSTAAHFTYRCPMFALAVLLSPLTLPAQSALSGQVRESSGQPLPFANVLLLTAVDSSLVKGMVANETGNFSLSQVSAGTYLLVASMLGYQQRYSSPFRLGAGESLRLPPLVLADALTQLNEVTVEAQKPLFEQHLDRLVVNVQSSITATGSTALDVLERSPGITVNRQTNALSMNGKNGVNVMINGKPARIPMEAVLQMLSGMQAANVEKIELITTPSAGHDAEGNAGVINIVLRKNQEYGTNGTLTLTMGYGAFEKPAASLSLNHRTSKLNLYGDYSFSWDHFRAQFRNSRQVRYQNQLIRTDALSLREPYFINHTPRLGFDYSVSDRTTFSGLLSGFSNTSRISGEKIRTDFRKDGQLTEAFNLLHDEINQWRHLMGNLNVRHSFGRGQELSLDLDYVRYHNHNPHDYVINHHRIPENTIRQELLRIRKRTPIRLWVGKGDYSKSFGSKTRLEAGLKATLSRLDNTVEVSNRSEEEWVIHPDYSGDMNMREDIAAAYVNMNYQLSNRTKLQTGLRYEYTRTDLSTPEKPDLIRRRYGNLFPSLFISHELSRKSNVQLSYGRRITRPTYNNMAPFVFFSDPNTFFSGNIYLLPAITDALQATYRFNESYLLSLNYSYDTRTIIPWQVYVDPQTNYQYARAENLKHSQTYSLNFSFPLRVGNWWQMQYNLSGVWQQNHTAYDGRDVRVAASYGQVNVTQTFTLPADFTLELTGFYQSRYLMGIAIMKSSGTFDAGLQKKLKNDRGTFRLTIDDIFWTQRFYMVNNQPTLNLNHVFLGRFYEPRTVRLSYSRNLGSKNLKAINRRSTGSDEERNRVGN